jgi:hypothetical protein
VRFFGVELGDAVAVGAGAAAEARFLAATPLFQTNFFPDLTQVYLIPAEVLIWPEFLQVVPGFTAAVAIGSKTTKAREVISNPKIIFLMSKLW